MDNNYGNGSYGNNGYGPANQNRQNGYPQQNGYGGQAQQGFGPNNYGQPQQGYGQPQGMSGYGQQPNPNMGGQQSQGFGSAQQNMYQQQPQMNQYGQNPGYVQSPNYVQPPKKKGGLVVAIVAGVAVIGLVIGGVFFVLGSNPKVQIAKAAKKTFEAPYIIEMLSETGFDEAKGVGMNLSLKDKVNDENMIIGFAADEAINFNLKLDYTGEDIPGGLYGNMSLVDYEVACKLNMQDVDMEFKFDLDAPSELLDGMLSESGVTLEDLKKAINDARDSVDDSSRDTDSSVEKLSETWEEYLNNMKFEKGNKDKVKIDGEEVECKTFNALLNKDETEKLFDDLYSIMESADTEDELKYQMDNTLDSIFDGEDVHLCIGIYKGALAKISLKHGDLDDCEEIELQFNGGEFRAQNMQLVADDEVALQIKGESDKDSEEYKLLIDDYGTLEEVFSYEYNKSTGEFNLTAGGETLPGKLIIDDGVTYTINESDIELSMELNPIKDKVTAIDVASKYYINDMSEEEFAEMIMEFSGMGGMDYTPQMPEYDYPVIEEPVVEEPVIDTPDINLSGNLINADGSMTVYIDNTPITLGKTKYEDLKNAGWTFDKKEYEFDDGTTTLASGEYTYATISLQNTKYGTDWDSAEIMIGLCNPTSGDIDLYDAYIWAISADSRSGFDLLDKYPIISLGNGLMTGADYNTVITMMGQSDNVYESDYGYDSLSYDIEDYDLEIDVYDDGGVSSISAKNYNWSN